MTLRYFFFLSKCQNLPKQSRKLASIDACKCSAIAQCWSLRKYEYHKVLSTSTSCLEAQAGFFRLSMKRKQLTLDSKVIVSKFRYQPMYKKFIWSQWATCTYFQSKVIDVGSNTYRKPFTQKIFQNPPAYAFSDALHCLTVSSK